MDRFLAGVAYLDGSGPASSWRAATTPRGARRLGLAQRRAHQRLDLRHRTSAPEPYAAWRGQGNHNLSIADVDGDGRDEIIYGAAAIDDNGTGCFSTAWATATRCTSPTWTPTARARGVPSHEPRPAGPNGAELRDAAPAR